MTIWAFGDPQNHREYLAVVYWPGYESDMRCRLRNANNVILKNPDNVLH